MKRFLLILVAVFVSVCFFPFSAMAETVLQDGLQVVVTTDKSEYTSSETISMTLSVTNTNSCDVTDVSMAVDIPERYAMRSGSDYKRLDLLEAGQSAVLSVSFASYNVPSTGDFAQLALWMLLLVTSMSAITWIMINSRHTAKRLLSIVMIMACLNLPCMSGLLHTEAHAENRNETIYVSQRVLVDGQQLELIGCVNYTINSNDTESGVFLQNFTSARNNIRQGYEEPVVFSVEMRGNPSLAETVGLYDHQGKLVAMMHDDGNDMDKVQNDGLYSCSADLSGYLPGQYTFFAATTAVRSSSVTIYVYEKHSTKMEEERLQICEYFSELTEQFSDQSGYVPYQNRGKALEAAVQYAEKLLKEGKIYYYEHGEGCVLLKLRSGVCLTYTPRVEGVLAGTSADSASMRVYTYLTYDDLKKDYYISNAAETLESKISNYSYSHHYETSAVTLDQIKSFSDNQIIIWYGHANGWTTMRGTMIPTGEVYDAKRMGTNPEYEEDILENRLYTTDCSALGIFPAYIEKRCRRMANSVVYIATCWSAKSNHLGDAFLNKGALAFIGYKEETPQDYAMDILKHFFNHTVKINPETNQYYTVTEAMDKAKDKEGSSCDSYYNPIKASGITWPFVQLDTPTSPILRLKSQDFRLQDLPFFTTPYVETGNLSLRVVDGENESEMIPSATVTITGKQGIGSTREDHHVNATTQKDGLLYISNVPVGTYDVTVSHSMYQPVTKTITIVRNDTTDLDIKLNPLPTGTLAGIVKHAETNAPILQATVDFVSLGPDNIHPVDTDGKYHVARVPVGTVDMEISAPGFITLKVSADVCENETTYMESFLLVEGSDDEFGYASGKVMNAISGEALSGVEIVLTDGWNNTDQNNPVAIIKTDSNGQYTYQGYAGYYTANISCNGYVDTIENLIICPNVTTSGQNINLAPLADHSQYRIKLTWGANPSDLDSHVYGTLSNGNTFHTFYSSKDAYDGNEHICNLDVDDTTSYGPEVITLTASGNRPYYYFIHRYAGSGSIASSDARIEVYKGNTLVRIFNAPTDLGSGDYWNVFAIVNGQLVVRNTITSNAEVSYASTNMLYRLIRSVDLLELDLPSK